MTEQPPTSVSTNDGAGRSTSPSTTPGSNDNENGLESSGVSTHQTPEPTGKGEVVSILFHRRGLAADNRTDSSPLPLLCCTEGVLGNTDLSGGTEPQEALRGV